MSSGTIPLASKQRALFGILLIFSITSLLLISFRTEPEAHWVPTKRPNIVEDKGLDTEKVDYNAGGDDNVEELQNKYFSGMSNDLKWNSNEDRMDPERPIRGPLVNKVDSGIRTGGGGNEAVVGVAGSGEGIGGAGSEGDVPRPNQFGGASSDDEEPLEDDEDFGAEDDESGIDEDGEDGDDMEEEYMEDDMNPADSYSPQIAPPPQVNRDATVSTPDSDTMESDPVYENDGDLEGSEDTIQDSDIGVHNHDIIDGAEPPIMTPMPVPQFGTSFMEAFDHNGVLNETQSFLLYIPSGETIEAQFFSLCTAIWMARHSGRTLIIPPPMIPPPVYGPKTKDDQYKSISSTNPTATTTTDQKQIDFVHYRDQRWGFIMDLRQIARTQPTVLLDTIRHAYRTRFSMETIRDEFETLRTSSGQQPEVMFEKGDTLHANEIEEMPPVTIPCHGTPTSASWKQLDFTGRHFLNKYGIRPTFDIKGDKYWSMSPASIRRHWRAQTIKTTVTEDGVVQNTDVTPEMDHHQQIVCISGADQVALAQPEVEERIWQEVGNEIKHSKAVRIRMFSAVLNVLRALERRELSNGYIGLHFDKFEPIPTSACLSTSPPTCLQQPQEKQSQSKWSIDMALKRIRELEATEPKRPVIVTTTETDPVFLGQLDELGWLRLEYGLDDIGLDFFELPADLGVYGPDVLFSYAMSNSAIFLGSRQSPLSVAAAFRIKAEGKTKRVPSRWELY